MASEPKRGCGYRKVGGLYMVSGNLSSPCGRLPVELHVCPVCNAGIKQTRSFQWINPRALLAKVPDTCDMRLASSRYCTTCPLSPANLPERAGLLWIGQAFYPTPADFMKEAAALGVSRRISALPRGFKLGEDWVLMAHPVAVERTPNTDEEREELAELNAARAKDELPLTLTLTRPGIVTMFRPVRFEKIVTDTEAKDTEAMDALRAKGITPVAVRDNDPDHMDTRKAKRLQRALELQEEGADE